MNLTDKKKELIVRTISGVVFSVATLAAIFLHPLAYIALFGFFLFCSMKEYLDITIGKGSAALKAAALTTGLSAFLFSGFIFSDMLVYTGDLVITISAIAGMLAFLSLPVINLFEKGCNGLEHAWAVQLYVALPFCLTTLLYACGKSTIPYGWPLAALMILLWAGDVGAYCIGTALGQGPKGHRLMPSVSPKKSWEGVIGGAVFALAAGIILWRCGVLFGSPSDKTGWLSAVIYSLAVFAAGVLGDLVESRLKRKSGVKDSGSIMPGHGGFLDRFDGALLAVPVALVLYFIISG